MTSSCSRFLASPLEQATPVPNFYRVAEWARRLLVRGMGLMLDHFFEKKIFCGECSKVAAFSLQQTFTLLGLQLDPGKPQMPSEVAHILGVAFKTCPLASQRCLQGGAPKLS